jgi:hypothetical protein
MTRSVNHRIAKIGKNSGAATSNLAKKWAPKLKLSFLRPRTKQKQ